MPNEADTKAAEPAAIKAAFNIVLAQYNQNLGIAIDVSQKCIALLLTVATIYFALHHGCATGDEIPRWTIGSVAGGMVAFFIWMQWKYFERCRNSMKFLTDNAAVAHPYGLSTLGILDGEHRRIIAMWSAAFVVIVLAVAWLMFRRC